LKAPLYVGVHKFYKNVLVTSESQSPEG
jgi:hypothetical protein